MHTRASLTADLARLGVTAGDTLFVHSSYKSLGTVEEGAAAVIAAMEDCLGPDGLLLMPSFNLAPKGYAARAKVWSVETTPSSVGWLTEYFRMQPGVHRSDHYSHSVAARGKDAERFVGDHLSLDGPESPWDRAPWGRTYGNPSPFMNAYRRPNGKVLMLGVDYNTSTYCHLVEVLFTRWKRAQTIDAPHCMIDRQAVGEFWDALGRLSRGRVGDADCRLFGIADYVNTVLAAVKQEPSRFIKAYRD